MNFFEKMWTFVNHNIFSDHSDLKAKVKMSANEVSERARSHGESIGWSSENMRPPHLMVEENKLVWRVRFASVDEDNLPVKGGHLIVVIDDESGKVVKIIIGSR